MTKAMSVQVKHCPLRSQPTFLGRVVSRLDYGDKVEVDKEENSWCKVAPSGKNTTGWVHVSALSTKDIILNPNSREVREAPSSDEIALAGKGFNKQVEEKFKQNNRNIDFTWIDTMEKIIVPQDKMVSFLGQGNLKIKGIGS